MTPARAALAWGALFVIAFVNGGIRELILVPRFGQHLANQLSVALGCLAMGTAISLLLSRWPTSTPGAALRLGVLWASATVIFEFAFGRFVGHHSWERLLFEYRIDQGRLWPLVLLTIAFVPFVTQSLHGSRMGK